MDRALRLAARGMGRVEPNPMVGCVIVRAGRIIGEGFHRRFGRAHAEVDALKRCGTSPKGATAYVTLEPCSHFGKTPPCCNALIEAGVKRVVVAMIDPFEQVSGRGIRKLRRAGIGVAVGLKGEDAAALNRPYRTRLRFKRPYVICKWAQSIDGKIATRTGDSKWISCEQARRFAHRLRGRVDAIIVGAGTVFVDDPSLTARDVAIKRVATRVVLDTSLRTAIQCQLVRTARELPTAIVASAEAINKNGARVKRLRGAGVELIGVRTKFGRINIQSALSKMAAMGWTNVLVEGGGEVIGACFDAGVVDEAWVFTAPFVIGGRDVPSGCDGTGAATVAGAIRPIDVRRRMLGDTQLTQLQFDRLAKR